MTSNASKRALVVGSGAIGLRTAIELIQNNIQVSLYSKTNPLHKSNCSQGAGGFWMPYKCNDERITKWSLETLEELIHLSKSSNIIEIVPAVILQKKNYVQYPNNLLPSWTSHKDLSFQALTVEMLHWQNSVHKLRIPSEDELKEAGYQFCWLFQSPIIDAPKMLQEMLNTVKSHPLTNTMNLNMERPFISMNDILDEAEKLKCDTVINCTGLGAMNLCNDKSLIGGRGALLYYDRYNCPRRSTSNDYTNDAVITAEEPPWGSETLPAYCIPRGGKIAIGGTYLEGNHDDKISSKERESLQRNAYIFGIDTDNATHVEEWVGFRPVRKPNVRVEIDESFRDRGIRVIHNYGHGGSGWTTFVGVARDVLKLVLHS